MKFKDTFGNFATWLSMMAQTLTPGFGTATEIATTTAKITPALVTAITLTWCGDKDDNNTIEKKETPPTINVIQSTIDITWWKEVRVSWNSLYIWNTKVASRNGDNCKVSLSFKPEWSNRQNISNLANIRNSWTLNLKVWNTAGTKEQNFNLTEQSNNSNEEKIKSRFENLKNISFKVDEEVNLLAWFESMNYEKIQAVIEWETYDIDPNHCIIPNCWNGYIILSAKNKNWEITEYKSGNITIEKLESNPISYTAKNPGEIMPIFWEKIEFWDKNGIESIEQLWIPEAREVIKMMLRYWTSTHSPEEIKKHINRLNISIMWEDNSNENDHLYVIKNILNTITPTINPNVLENYWESIEQLCQNQPKDAINLILYSAWDYSKTRDNYEKAKKRKNLDKFLNTNNILRITATTDIRGWNVELIPEKSNLKEWSYLSYPQSQASKIYNVLITSWVGRDGTTNFNKTNWGYITSWSCYPSNDFDPEVLFAWRPIPAREKDWWPVFFEDWNPTASFTNVTTTATIGQWFMINHNIKNVNDLKNFVTSSSDTNYMYKDWKTQKLHLVSPANCFNDLYTSNLVPPKIEKWQTITIKPNFRWTIPIIPWMRINGVLFYQKNESIIKSINLFTDNVNITLSYEDLRKFFTPGDEVSYYSIATNNEGKELLHLRSKTKSFILGK